MSIPLSSTLPEVDRYLADGFDSVRGMSSRFGTTIAAYLLARQSRLGIQGHFAEIGTFEGRLYIALALALADGEVALGIDSFDWPDEGVLERFRVNCARWGVPDGRLVVHKGRSEDMTPGGVLALMGGPARLWHVDGAHGRKDLQRDLDLACATLHPEGVIVVDDMLHPEYPLLVVAVHEWLERNPEMRVLCVIDREDIVAAAKFVLCRHEAVARYEDDLMATFKAQHYVMGSEWERYFCVVLTQAPRLVKLD